MNATTIDNTTPAIQNNIASIPIDDTVSIQPSTDDTVSIQPSTDDTVNIQPSTDVEPVLQENTTPVIHNNSPRLQINEILHKRISDLLNGFTPHEVESDDETAESSSDVYCGACALQLGKQDNTPPLFMILNTERLMEYMSSMRIGEFYDILVNTRHPTRGYTYLHQLCWTYFHEKPSFKNPALARDCNEVIRFLSFAFHDAFSTLVNTGIDKEGRENNTPLHESLRDVPKIGYDDHNLIHLFKRCGLNMNQKDSHGFSINDYIHKKQLDKRQQQIIRNLTSEFKTLETTLYEKMKEICPEHFIVCNGCGKEMYRNNNILTFPDHLIQENFTESEIDMICNIIEIRKQISNIYAQEPTSKMKRNHDYVIEAWLQKIHQIISTSATHNNSVDTSSLSNDSSPDKTSDVQETQCESQMTNETVSTLPNEI